MKCWLACGTNRQIASFYTFRYHITMEQATLKSSLLYREISIELTETTFSFTNCFTNQSSILMQKQTKNKFNNRIFDFCYSYPFFFLLFNFLYFLFFYSDNAYTGCPSVNVRGNISQLVEVTRKFLINLHGSESVTNCM